MPTTAPPVPQIASSTTRTALVSLVALSLMHALVDAVAMVIEPVWPLLKLELELSSQELLVLLSVTAVAANFSQLVFGYLGDRYGSRYLLWLGPAIATVCLCAVGWAGNSLTLGTLLALGYTAVGSFHPEATGFAGSLIPEQRTRAISLFIFGGTVGLSVGPIISGHLAGDAGLQSLTWLIVPCLAIVALVQWFGIRGAARVAKRSSQQSPASMPVARRRWKLGLFLLIVCSLRIVPNVGIVKAISFTLAAENVGPGTIGNTQSIFLVAGSVGLLLLALCSRHGWERWLMIWSPLAAVPLLLALSLPDCPYWLLVTLLIPTGLILVGSTPVMVSYSHQLFPRGTGMASALTMGLSWGVGGLAVAELTTYFVELGHPAWLFAAFVPSLVLAAVGAAFLPKLPQEIVVDASKKRLDTSAAGR